MKNLRMKTVTYDLFVDGQEPEKEELMERATKEHPLTYCEGVGMMLPLFEEQLKGKTTGDKFDFTIPAQEAYGEYDDEAVLTLAREMFEIDGQFDEGRVVVGNIVPMTTAEGQIVNAQVVEITDQNVTIDLNHPLAGENLHFVGTIIADREATQEDIDQLTRRCGCSGGGCNTENCNTDECGGCGNCK